MVDIAKMNWDYLQTFLPTGWVEKMKELGMLKYGRKFAGEEGAVNLLRTLLIHLASNISLRSTSTLAKQGGIVDISDVALLKRLKKSGEWFSWLTQQTLIKMHILCPLFEQSTKFNYRFIDGSVVKEPGATGSTWRLHYSISASTLSADEIIVTDQKRGESFTNYSVNENDVLIGDRAYATRNGVFHVHENSGFTLARFSPSKLPMDDESGEPFKLLEKLTSFKIGEIKEFNVTVRQGEKKLKGRICVIRKSEEQAKLAQKKVRLQASKCGYKPKDSSLEFAKYILVFTTLPDTISADKILAIYRYRWQIEIFFKRLKSIIGVAPLYKKSKDGMEGWLNGKIFVATLIEYIIRCGESFFPWGYPVECRG